MDKLRGKKKSMQVRDACHRHPRSKIQERVRGGPWLVGEGERCQTKPKREKKKKEEKNELSFCHLPFREDVIMGSPENDTRYSIA